MFVHLLNKVLLGMGILQSLSYFLYFETGFPTKKTKISCITYTTNNDSAVQLLQYIVVSHARSIL